jgi:acetylornithine deacetylase/succinyl-diaminopimelate desuccinylase-like protein
MKAGITAILSAVEKIEPANYKIKVCFGVDEENESKGAYVLVNSDFLDDCIACIVPEVGSGRAKQAKENIVIGRHGRNRIGVKVVGNAAHASTPEYIINPIEYALEFINEAKKVNLGDDPDMPPDNISVAGIHSKGGGLSSPEECVIWFDNLFSPHQTSESIFRQYQDICDLLNKKYHISSDKEINARASIPEFSLIDLQNLDSPDKQIFDPRSTPFMEPWKIQKEHPLVKCASKIVRKLTGKEPVLTTGKSNADENYIGQKVPTIVIPPRGGNEHQAGEYVEIESIEDTKDIIENIIIEYMSLR